MMLFVTTQVALMSLRLIIQVERTKERNMSYLYDKIFYFLLFVEVLPNRIKDVETLMIQFLFLKSF